MEVSFIDRTMGFREKVREKQRVLGKEAEIFAPIFSVEPFHKSAMEVDNVIAEVAKVMDGHRKDYLDSISLLGVNERRGWEEADKDGFEKQVQAYISDINQSIHKLKDKLVEIHQKNHLSKLVVDHYGRVISSLWMRLTDCNQKYVTMKTQRMKLQVKPKERQQLSGSVGEVYVGEEEDVEEDLMSEKMKQKLQTQNRLLHAQLQNDLDVARRIEKQVYDLSRIQQDFANKVMSQQTEIENLFSNTLQTLDSVDRANEELEQATRRGRDTRFIMMMIILACSFILLLMHTVFSR